MIEFRICFHGKENLDIDLLFIVLPYLAAKYENVKVGDDEEYVPHNNKKHAWSHKTKYCTEENKEFEIIIKSKLNIIARKYLKKAKKKQHIKKNLVKI